MNKISRNKPPSKNESGMQANKFSYSFQPALNHLNYNNLPSSKSSNRGAMNLGNLGFLSLPKAGGPLIKGKPELMPVNPYKY
jgi:hypothetical protein